MSPRRPTSANRSHALPTLAALLAAGISVDGCVAEAHAQTPPPPADAGAQPDAGAPPAHRHPVRPPQSPPTPPEQPSQIDGGISKVGAYP